MKLHAKCSETNIASVKEYKILNTNEKYSKIILVDILVSKLTLFSLGKIVSKTLYNEGLKR